MQIQDLLGENLDYSSENLPRELQMEISFILEDYRNGLTSIEKVNSHLAHCLFGYDQTIINQYQNMISQIVPQTRRQHTDFEDALNFLSRVKSERSNEDYRKFLSIVKNYKQQKITVQCCVEQVLELFADSPSLMEGFKHFLPSNGEERHNDRSYNSVCYNAENINVTITKKHTPSASNRPSSSSDTEKARAFVRKVKQYCGAEMYKKFLQLMHAYNIHGDKKLLLEEMAELLRDYPDLVVEFYAFSSPNTLPTPGDASGKILVNDVGDVRKKEDPD